MNPAQAVEAEYVDAFRVRRRVPRERLDAVRRAMGVGPEDRAAEAGPDPVRVMRRAGEAVDPPAELVLEDGASLGVLRRLPHDLPHGYHRLLRDEADQMLIAPPAGMHAPRDHAWGWAAQLYAARSAQSWGIGDLADLRALAGWSRGLGARYLLVNPLNAATPSPQPEPSPYFPSTRRFRDPLYLRVEEVPGAELAADAVRDAADHARSLNGVRLIDRGRVQELKLEALGRIWAAAAAGRPDARFDAYRHEQADGLRQWATFAALAERFGAGWRRWPADLHGPAAPGVAAFARDHESRIAFHEWLQWLLDEQLRAAGASIGLVTDLPVGFDPNGFDAWAWQAQLSQGATVGSPPDQFNPTGQDWGLPPFVPQRLRAARYGPWIETLRAGMRHAGGLRIDHVLGLFRQWWVPFGSSADQGAYVRYAADEQLAILAIESRRAGALVIGEDLGTVAAGVRRRLRDAGVLSTRLAYFEREPAAIPFLAMAAITNHDLPTLAGAWTGADLAELEERGIPHLDASSRRLARRLSALSGLAPGAPTDAVVIAAHATLAGSPAAVVTATLEDALLVPERANIPGTTRRQRPNWSLALPQQIEALRDSPFAARLAAAISEARPAAGPRPEG